MLYFQFETRYIPENRLYVLCQIRAKFDFLRKVYKCCNILMTILSTELIISDLDRGNIHLDYYVHYLCINEICSRVIFNNIAV